MLRIIEAFSKISRLKQVHPIEKLVLCIFPIVILGFSKSTLPLIINIVVFLILHIKCKNPLNIVFKFTLGILSFSIISSIPIFFDYGIYYCLLIILKGFAGGVSICFLALTTPIDDILSIIAKYDSLRDICDITKSMERFLILIEEEYKVLYNSIKSRGGFDGFYLKIKNTGKMAGLLFANSIRRWEDIKNGINSRCYRGYHCYLKRDFNSSTARFANIFIYNVLLITLVVISRNSKL